jgi:hypothetical protein
VVDLEEAARDDRHAGFVNRDVLPRGRVGEHALPVADAPHHLAHALNGRPAPLLGDYLLADDDAVLAPAVEEGRFVLERVERNGVAIGVHGHAPHASGRAGVVCRVTGSHAVPRACFRQSKDELFDESVEIRRNPRRCVDAEDEVTDTCVDDSHFANSL